MDIDTTIVISNFNYGQFLNSSLLSCVLQSIKCQIIVVDDASTDGSWSIICKMISLYNKLPILGVKLKNNSGGNARGKNIGIALSNTKYITCLDSDDMLLQNSVYERKRELDANSDILWVHGRSFMVRSESNFLQLNNILSRPDYKRHITIYPFKAYSEIIGKKEETDIAWYRGVEASTVLARRSLYEEFGLYDENMKWKIDREMWYRWLAKGAKKKFIDKRVSIYRKHNKQETENNIKKNPVLVNKVFDIITVEREKLIDENNTLLLKNYKPNSFIDIKIGSLVS